VTASVRICSSFALLSSYPSLPAHLIKRHPFAAELLALSQETFARVALTQERLMLVTQLIPEVVEVCIVRSIDDVRELVKQGVRDLFYGQELPRVMMISESDEDSLCAIDVET
jgi:hypothetical protein